MKKKIQTFNDGIVKIYKVDDIADPGNLPKQGLILKESLRFDKKTVGMSRFWTAMQAQVMIDRIIRVPQKKNVSTQDIAIPNDGEKYKIMQIQYPEDVIPPIMDLSLQRSETDYDID